MIKKDINGNNLSANYDTYVKADSRQWLAKLLVGGTELSCDIDYINIEKGSCGGAMFELGDVIGSSMNTQVRNLATDVKGVEIECQIGLWTGSSYEWVSVGIFKASEVKKTHYATQITAYSSVISDTNVWFEYTAISSFPTLLQVANQIATQTGRTITFDAGIDTSLQMNKSLNGMSIYQALQVLAICCGGYVINSADNNILVKQYDATQTATADAGMMVKLPEFAEEVFDIQTVFCTVSPDSQDENGNPIKGKGYGGAWAILTAMVNGVEYTITNEDGVDIDLLYRTTDVDLSFSSEYITKEMFMQNVNDIVGYAYTPADIGLSLGDPRLEGDDVLSVADIDGTTYIVPCHKISHYYDGGFSSHIISAPATEKANDIGTSLPITSQIQSVGKEIVTAKAEMSDKISLITGNKGGYVVIKPNESGEPEEILIMDTPNIDTAVNVWRWNKSGIGYSSTGYNGDFATAWTIDGKFVADYIQSGVISDEAQANKWNLDTGYFITKQGQIGSWLITATGLVSEAGAVIKSSSSSPTHSWEVQLQSGGLSFLVDDDRVSKYEAWYNETQQRGESGIECDEAFSLRGYHGSIFTVGYEYGGGSGAVTADKYHKFTDGVAIFGGLSVSGTKSRLAETDDYGERLFYAYETPTPFFGDIGEGVIGEDGKTYVAIDPVFSEAVNLTQYQVFLQKYGSGEAYVSERNSAYFVVEGTAGLSFGWEVKAKQKGYDHLRMDRPMDAPHLKHTDYLTERNHYD